jgi:hypothetical protein
MGRAGEVIAVAWLLEPAVLPGGLARLPARGLGAVALALSATRVGSKEGLTVLALPFGEWTSHWPISPQANDRKIGVRKEENDEVKNRAEAERRTRKKGIKITGGEEDGLV